MLSGCRAGCRTLSPALFLTSQMHLPFPNSDVATARAPLVAVTGATGFIGRHLIAALMQAGWRVRLLLRREPGSSQKTENKAR